MPLLLEKPDSATTPKYQLLAQRLRRQILSRELSAGDRLPTFAEMRSEYNVTSSTVERMYGVLEQEGLIERQPRRGLFVADHTRVLTGNIGLIGGMAFKEQRVPYYTHIMHGVQETARRHKKRLLYLGTFNDCDMTSFDTIDGLLLSGYRQHVYEEIRCALPADLPCVSMFKTNPDMISVVSDDYGGAELAVSKLLELGHQRIACLMQKGLLSLRGGRFAGYCDAMQSAGIKVNDDWIRLAEKPQRGSTAQNWARQLMQDWLQDGWKKTRCTALLVQNDMAAIRAMQVLQEAGIDVPGDVSVVGFDGTEMCDYTNPRLAAVQLPLELIGATAVDVLMSQIENGASDLQTIVLPASWREGDSVAALSRRAL